MHASPCRRPLPLLCAVGMVLGGAAWAADLRPSWECLPDDTAVMVRLPAPAAFLDELRTRTKFGAVVLGADRMRQAWDLAVQAWGETGEDADDLVDPEERLAKYGLGMPDLEAACTGDAGLGIVARACCDDRRLLMMTLVWLEPGAESAERFVAAYHRRFEELADDEFPPERVELELAGHQVTWVTRPLVRVDLGDVTVDDAKLANLADVRRILAERAKQAPKVVVGRQHFWLARIGGRLLAGQSQTVPRGGVGLEAGAKGANLRRQVENESDDAAADPDLAGGSDEMRGIVERFLAAHAADDDAPLAAVVNAAGIRAALPAGTPLVDAVVDPRPLLELAKPSSVKQLAAAGLADLGPAALRIAFDAGVLRQCSFVTLPAPRAGVFRILDQECDAAEVPSFVTSEAIDFTQISLDLAAAYRTVKEFAIAEGGDQAVNGYATVEAQAQAVLGTDLEAMLANLGSRHWVVRYPPQVAAAIQEARRAREAGGGAAPLADRVALVWKLEDDAPVIALLPKLAALAQVQVVEEQGFEGVRLPGGGAAVFAGRGHLVVGMGGDALEKTLAGIRNPPVGAASFRESDVPRKAAELVGAGPARMFSVGDATRTGGLLGELREGIAALAPEDVENDDDRALLEKVRAIMPSAEELQGMFGVGAALLEATDAGVALKSAWEMPAP